MSEENGAPKAFTPTATLTAEEFIAEIHQFHIAQRSQPVFKPSFDLFRRVGDFVEHTLLPSALRTGGKQLLREVGRLSLDMGLETSRPIQGSGYDASRLFPGLAGCAAAIEERRVVG